MFRLLSSRRILGAGDHLTGKSHPPVLQCLSVFFMRAPVYLSRLEQAEDSRLLLLATFVFGLGILRGFTDDHREALIQRFTTRR